MNPAQTSTLRRAAVWLATLLVLLQCGWVFIGCSLGLASIESVVFLPSLAKVDPCGAGCMLLVVALLACLQVVAVWRENASYSFIVGFVFLGFGILTFVGCLAWAIALAEQGPPDPWEWRPVILTSLFLFFPMTWLFIGMVMIQHAFRIEPPLVETRLTP